MHCCNLARIYVYQCSDPNNHNCTCLFTASVHSHHFDVPLTHLPPQYAPFAYEAMQAMLLAFHALATRKGPGPLSVTAKEVYEEMLEVNFTGITGQVCL